MSKFFVVLLCGLLIQSCASTSSTEKREALPPPQANENLNNELSKAKSILSSNTPAALQALNQLAKKHSDSLAGLEASKILGDYFARNRKWNEAISYYNVILQNNYLEPFEPQVAIQVSRIYTESNAPQKALETLNRTLSYTSLPQESRIELLNARLEPLKSLQDVSSQLETLSLLFSLSPRPQDKESFRARAVSLTDSLSRPEDLQQILSNSQLAFVHSPIHFRLGNVAFENSDFSNARNHFSRVISLNPESEYAEASQEFLQQLDARFSVDSRTVGVILPLSGRYADIGRSVLTSIQLGLGIYDRNSNIKLAVIDSEGRQLDARKAVEKLVIEDKVIAIIGSLQSRTAAAISSKAQSLGVPTIVLSQKSGLTDIGPFIFRNALTSEMQVDHLVKTAREQLGITKFAVLFPEDAYGTEYANIFWTTVEKYGGQVRAAQSYDPKETDFRTTIQKLVGTFHVEDRKAEYDAKLKEWEAKNKGRARVEVPRDLLPPLVDFEALFIPDNTRALGQISAMLSVSDVKGITLLGTNLWNTAGVAERAGHFANQTYFVDSFLRSDEQFTQSPIVREFQTKVGRVPSLFDIQAYDTAVVLKRALSSASSRTDLRNELANLSNVRGSLTELSMLPTRDLSRPIVTLKLDGNNIVLLR